MSNSNYIKILNSPGSVIIDDYNCKTLSGKTYLFSNPSKILTAYAKAEIDEVISAIESEQKNGKYAAGYIAYDAFAEDNRKLTIPYIWMGIYESVKELDYSDSEINPYDNLDSINNIHLNISEHEYLDCIGQIKEYIASGDIYQANFTCKLLFENSGSAAGLFARLRRAHPVNHSAFINAGDFQVISLSPELFLRKSGNEITTKPMKGTYKRGRYYEEDMRFANHLKTDSKNKAENLMIVDLMRNDLGRICEYGSINVAKLFEVEHYKSVLQMVSEVEGELKPEIPLLEILKSTFPPGSVTGAPKIRAMEVINELEKEVRGVYCGGIGMFKPDGDFLLNVAIRTILQQNKSCEMGIGSGIVADSDAESEFNETLLKSSFLKEEPIDFELLETMLYTKHKGYYLLYQHLERMSNSAKYFGFHFHEDSIKNVLERISYEMDNDDRSSKFMVRILNYKNGVARIEHHPIYDIDKDINLLLSSKRINPDNPFLYNKTTHRAFYDLDLKDAREKGYDNVFYLNRDGFVTECTNANIFVYKDGSWKTPPVKHGLLPGVFRENLIKKGEVVEDDITLQDLLNADRIMIGNSVRTHYVSKLTL